MGALPAREFATPPPEEAVKKPLELKVVPPEQEEPLDTAEWVQQEALKNVKRTPDGRIAVLAEPVPKATPRQEAPRVPQSPAESAPEVAKWVAQEHAFALGLQETERQSPETQTLTDLTEELDVSMAQRTKLEQDIRRLDSPIHKAVEALGKIGMLKDTVTAFATWKQERVKLEDALDSVDRLVAATEQQIKNIVTQREAGMQTQSTEIAKGSPDAERELVEKWFYNGSADGGPVSEEAYTQWDAIMNRDIVEGVKGLDTEDQAKIDNWFTDPDAFVEEVDAGLEEMTTKGEATVEDRVAWREGKLPPDTREAIEARLKVLQEDTVTLEQERGRLEDAMRKAFSGGKRPEHFHEKLHFDGAFRRKYLGGWMSRLFKSNGGGAEAFLRLEPELRRVDGQLAINHEAMRRVELMLKDPHAAVREAAVREIGLRRRFMDAKTTNPSAGRMPGSMRGAA